MLIGFYCKVNYISLCIVRNHAYTNSLEIVNNGSSIVFNMPCLLTLGLPKEGAQSRALCSIVVQEEESWMIYAVGRNSLYSCVMVPSISDTTMWSVASHNDRSIVSTNSRCWSPMWVLGRNPGIYSTTLGCALHSRLLTMNRITISKHHA